MLTTLAALLLTLTTGCQSSAPHEDAVLRLDPATTYQTIDGFGTSGAWWSPTVGGWDDKRRNDLLDLLFTERGARLTIFRYNLGAGSGEEIRDPWRRTTLIPDTPEGPDLSADANALRVVKGARERGVERFVIFTNSPPAELTRSGMVSGGVGGGENFDADNADAFARWLIDRADAIVNQYDLPDVSVSPINEPQWDWGGPRRHQEGAHYKPETTLAVLRAVAEEIDRRGSNLKLLGPEAGAWGSPTEQYLQLILDDPVVSQKLHRLAIHSYHSTDEERRALTRWIDERGRPIPVAMTEWCELRPGTDYTMDSAMVMAQVMHRDLVEAGVVEWTYWLGASKYNYRDGLIQVDRRRQVATPKKRLWTIAHYSRFIRPGAVRIDATIDGAPGVFVSAYRSADEKQLTVVLTNPTELAYNIRLPQLEKNQAAAIYLTDERNDLEPIAHNGTTVTLPGQALVSVVIAIK